MIGLASDVGAGPVSKFIVDFEIARTQPLFNHDRGSGN
jgi:hypothetical protein